MDETVYGNISISGCSEELLKSSKLKFVNLKKYQRKDDFFNVEMCLDEEEFFELLKIFQDYKLIAFEYGRTGFYLAFKDVGSIKINKELAIYEWVLEDGQDDFTSICFPTDKFLYKHIDSQTGILEVLDYENPAVEWWNGTEELEKSLNKKNISVKYFETYEDCLEDQIILADETKENDSIQHDSNKASIINNLAHINELNIPEGEKTIKIPQNIDLKKVKILNLPSTLNKISIKTLNQLTSLNKLNISLDNKKYSVLDDVIYTQDMEELIYYPRYKKDINFNLPEKVKKIGKNAFSSNKHLINLKINKNIESIEKEAFSYSKIENIFFESDVKIISDDAFFCSKKNCNLIYKKGSYIEQYVKKINKLDNPVFQIKFVEKN